MTYAPKDEGPPGANERALTTKIQTLVQNLNDYARAHGSTTLTDSESKVLFKSNRVTKFYFHDGVVTRHDHLDTGFQVD